MYIDVRVNFALFCLVEIKINQPKEVMLVYNRLSLIHGVVAANPKCFGAINNRHKLNE